MKDLLKKLVRALAQFPVVGTPVRIAMALRRLPALVETLGTHQNLVLSMPVALRKLRQDVEALRLRAGGEPAVETSPVAPRILSPDKLSAARARGIRLNLACGGRRLDDYLNVDRQALPGIDILADATALPFEAQEVDEIFSANMLVRFPCERLRRELLPYWQSLLKPGGSFRAVVPDADEVIRAYLAGRHSYDDLCRTILGRDGQEEGTRYSMFTRDHLSALLGQAGFVNVRIAASQQDRLTFEIAADRHAAGENAVR